MKLLPVAALAAAAAFSSSAQSPDPIDLVQKALRFSVEDDLVSREYVLTQESIEREIESDGKAKTMKRRTYEVIPLGGEPYRRLIRQDGKPLTEDVARREQQKFEKTARERAAESVEQRERRLRKYDEKIQGRRQMFDELPEAFIFRMVGEEEIGEHRGWVIEAKPKPGYQPKSFRTSFLTKMEGRIYISKTDGRMMKVDVVTTGPVSFGWFLAKMAPGTRITIEQMPLPEGIWVMKRFKINYDVKVALVKQFRGENEHLMWNYRREPVSARR